MYTSVCLTATFSFLYFHYYGSCDCDEKWTRKLRNDLTSHTTPVALIATASASQAEGNGFNSKEIAPWLLFMVDCFSWSSFYLYYPKMPRLLYLNEMGTELGVNSCPDFYITVNKNTFLH